MAGLVALVLNPLVQGLERVHGSRYLGVFGVYVGFVAVVALLAALIDYVKAQVLLSAALGGSVGLAMWFLGMIGAYPSGARYALFFGVWAGLMEAIPYLGPVLAAVPPTLVAAFDSALAALWVIVTFVLVQEIEGHIPRAGDHGQPLSCAPAGGHSRDPRRRRDPRDHRHAQRHPADPAGQRAIVFLRPRTQFEGWSAAAGGVVDSLARDTQAERPGPDEPAASG